MRFGRRDAWVRAKREQTLGATQCMFTVDAGGGAVRICGADMATLPTILDVLARVHLQN